MIGLRRRQPLTRPASLTGPRHPLRLRRVAVLRVMVRPRTAARLLEALADEADIYRYGSGVIIDACAKHHVPRDPFDIG